MKKFTAFLIASALLLTPAFVLAEGEIPVRSVKLKKSMKLTVCAGESAAQEFLLEPVISPESATCKVLEWSSSNAEVADVDQQGKVRTKTFGTAVVTARTTDGSGRSAKCKITVVQKRVTRVRLSSSRLTMTAGKTAELTATVSPDTAFDQTLTWKSSNEKVATVNESGVVTSVGKGTAEITARAADGSKKYAVCKVKVTTGNSANVDYRGNVYDLYTQLGADSESAVKDYIDSLGNKKGEKVVIKAISYLGTSYKDLDCADLTSVVFRSLKVKIGARSHIQAKNCRRYEVSRDALRPGDLVFFKEPDGKMCKCGPKGCWRYMGVHHVGIYAGDIGGTGYIIDASSVIGKIVIRKWNYSDDFAEMKFVYAARRFR